MKNSLFQSLRAFVTKHRFAESIGVLAVAFVVSVLWTEFRISGLENDLGLQSKEYIEKISSTASSTESLRVFVMDMQSKVDYLSNQSAALSGVVEYEQSKNAAIQEQVGKVSSTIGTLDKLSKTDPELLQKYSKVYFLNEHYTPESLASVASEFSFSKNTNYQVLAPVALKLDAMLRAAKNERLTLLVSSAYRSYGTQTTLKSRYKVTYGAGTANQFSADQGYSEHQLGTTLDFTTPGTGAELTGFETTPEYTWLLNNAYKYGFVLSYPKSNSYYIYEPWHWRYVGVDLANRLQRENKYFYDLDQRTIDNYLSLIFD